MNTSPHPVDNASRLSIHIQQLLSCPDTPDCAALVEEVFDESVPFMLFAHELSCVRAHHMALAIDRGNIDEIRHVQLCFDQIEESFAGRYIGGYLRSLERRNHLRLRHINSLSDKNLLVHFEAHLNWMQALIAAVRDADRDTMPEPDPSLCEFGRWLVDQGDSIIRDRSHKLEIERIHRELHQISWEMASDFDQPHINRRLYALIKRAELLSLDLGNEISLINNMVIMSSYNKDSLTGLLTRRSLDKVLFNQMEIAKATESSFCVIMCDLDHFKHINDRHGHLVGDQALQHFAQILRSALRQSDLLFRYGGEEFLVVLPSTNREQALNLAERVRLMLHGSPLDTPLHQVSISASFGVVEIEPETYRFIDKEFVMEVIREADSRLYQAKQRGRDCIV
ncbi:MAG: sensor domain-containing diguanylate cyclase [Halothiobacillaceae bacterium]|nr:sensor domain-containing diguanylate cyclase [Halothiobacillaceae bacterium]